MAFCKNCGTQIEEGAVNCANCGTAVEENKVDAAIDDITNKFNEFNNTADNTAEYDQNDINNNKVMAVLAYFGILVLIPIFAAKNSKYARFHSNQGLILAIVSIAWSIISRILAEIPVVNVIVSIIGIVIGIGTLVLAIIGIVNAIQGKAKELPIIGKYKLLK